MKPIRAALNFVDRRPLLAVLLGMLAAFAIEYLAAPQLTVRVDQPATHHVRSTA